MAITLSTTAKNAELNGIVTTLGASSTLKLYNGTKPAALGTPVGTLLATLTFGATCGTVASGVLTFGSVTQTNTGHVAGTPTFARLSDSAGTVHADIDIAAGAGNLQFTGTVVNGQNVTVTGMTFTAGN